MSFCRLFCTASLCIFLAFPRQVQDPKEMPENKGSIAGENTYHNPALRMTITLPGEWHFFDRTMYSSPEAKQKEKEKLDRSRAACTGCSVDRRKLMLPFNRHQPRHRYTRFS
jgi:hypothetical protein